MMSSETMVNAMTGLAAALCAGLIAFLWATGSVRTDLERGLVLGLGLCIIVAATLFAARQRQERRFTQKRLMDVDRLIGEMGLWDQASRQT